MHAYKSRGQFLPNEVHMMEILLYIDDVGKARLDRLKNVLSSNNIKYKLFELGTKIEGNYDMILVIGNDKSMLKAVHELNSLEIPFLGVSSNNSVSFLMEVPFEKIELALNQIDRGEYRIDECDLLMGEVGKKSLIALNEISIFPMRSATLMKYDLWIDGEYVWRDIADGIIISTPMGSTAYSMSAGGPMIMMNAQVFAITPVNSIDLTRRPLVVPNKSVIEVCEISSKSEVEAIADGLERYRVDEEIILHKANSYVRFIRLKKGSHAYLRLLGKVKLAKELIKMPPSAKLVMKVLEYEGPLTQRDIVKKTLLPPRTVRYALSILLRKGIISKVTNLRDARQSLYYIKVKSVE